jgi:hypothetical protein
VIAYYFNIVNLNLSIGTGQSLRQSHPMSWTPERFQGEPMLKRLFFPPYAESTKVARQVVHFAWAKEGG